MILRELQCYVIKTAEEQGDMDTNVQIQKGVLLILHIYNKFKHTDLRALFFPALYVSKSLISPFPAVLFFPGAIAPVALPAHTRWSPLPVQTFPQHGECGGRGRSTGPASCQAPLSQSQVAFAMGFRGEAGMPPGSLPNGLFGCQWPFKIFV